MSGWEQIIVGGKSVDVFDPPGGAQPRFGLLFLHGWDLVTLAGNPTWTALLTKKQFGCICPRSGRSWWTDRIWPEFDGTISAEEYVLNAVVPFAKARWQLSPRTLGIAGACMGGQGALKFAFKHAETFPAVAAIAPAVEYHELYWQGTAIDALYASKEQCRQDTAPMHVNPTNYPPHIFFCSDPSDPWLRGSERLHEKLAALGIEHDAELAGAAGGHSWNYYDHMANRALAFLDAGLARESRRLL